MQHITRWCLWIRVKNMVTSKSSGSNQLGKKGKLSVAVPKQVWLNTMWSPFLNTIGCVITEMGPDPARTYFWPAVNKRPTRLWPEYFLTRPDDIFFLPKGLNIEIFDIFRGNFPNPYPNQRWLTQPDPTWATKIWSDPTWATKIWSDPTRVKNFWPGPITM